MNFYKAIFSLVLSVIFSVGVFASEGHSTDDSTPEQRREAVKEFTFHHIQDAHDFIFFEDLENHKYYGFHLPVILWDNGLKVFSSKKFHWGHEVANVDGEYYKIYNNKKYNTSKIYKTDAEGTITLGEDGKPTNEKPLDFSITKNVVFILLAVILMFWLFTKMAKTYKPGQAPKGVAKFFEPIVLYVRDEIAIPNIGEKDYKKYMNYLLTVFFFVWLVNIFGLTPFGSNVTNSITVTFALAMFTFVLTQFTAKSTYWKHIFWMPGVPVPMKIILAPIELLGVFIKPFSLMIRLFANITAGHIVMMSLIGLIFIFKNWIGGTLSFGLAFAISLIEVLVAALQAYIFTMLSALYFGQASEEPHH